MRMKSCEMQLYHKMLTNWSTWLLQRVSEPFSHKKSLNIYCKVVAFVLLSQFSEKSWPWIVPMPEDFLWLQMKSLTEDIIPSSLFWPIKQQCRPGSLPSSWTQTRHRMASRRLESVSCCWCGDQNRLNLEEQKLQCFGSRSAHEAVASCAWSNMKVSRLIKVIQLGLIASC
jgi:hypothetical protein